MSRDQVLDRVRKLLRLAHDAGATQAEAETALMMAQKLMLEAGLVESEVAASVSEEEVVFSAIMKESRVESWRSRLGIVITRNFRCKMFWETAHERTGRHNNQMRYSSTLKFVGHAADVEIAREVYLSALQFAQDCGKAYVKERGLSASRACPEGRTIYNEFMFGFVSGLATKYDEQVDAFRKANSQALVVVDAPKDVVDAVNRINLKPLGGSSAKMGDEEARESGRETGRNFNHIRKMSSASGKGQLALPGKESKK